VSHTTDRVVQGLAGEADTSDVTPTSGRARAALTALTRFFSAQEHDAAATDRMIMARTVGLLFFAGAAVGLLSLLLP